MALLETLTRRSSFPWVRLREIREPWHTGQGAMSSATEIVILLTITGDGAVENDDELCHRHDDLEFSQATGADSEDVGGNAFTTLYVTGNGHSGDDR